MFMGYPTSQWINVGLYMVFMLALFIGISFVSVKLNNIFFGDVEKNNKINKVNNKNKKKQVFFDVA